MANAMISIEWLINIIIVEPEERGERIDGTPIRLSL